MILGPPSRSQMLKGLLDPCLLAVIGSGEAYGYEIVSRLERAGLAEVAEGSVYPALARLERMDLLDSERRVSDSGPPRKYYRLNALGTAYLDAWQVEWVKLADAIDSVLGTSPVQPRKETAE